MDQTEVDKAAKDLEAAYESVNEDLTTDTAITERDETEEEEIDVAGTGEAAATPEPAAVKETKVGI